MLKNLDKVLSLSARFIDVNFQSSRLTNIATKDGVAKDISLGELEGVGVRVLDKGWGFASSTNTEDLFEAAKRALKAAKRGNQEVAFNPRDGVVDKVLVKPEIVPHDIELEEKVDIGIRAHNSVKDMENVVSSSFSYVDSESEGLYANSEGSRISWESTKVGFFSYVFAESNGELQVGSERIGATGGLEILKDPEGAAILAGEKAQRLLKAKSAPSGHFKVIMDPLLTGVFIHEALGHAVEADHVIKGDSILEDLIDESVASELVTIYDDPTIEGSFGFYFYDNEGTKAKKTMLIQDGILEGYLHSRETSSTLNMKNTGNSRSQSFDHLPIVRMSNTFMEKGNFIFEELLEDISEGVYLLGSKGGEVDPARGVFQFSAEEGFLIEKGEITTPLKDVALSGETLTILREIDGVGRTFDSHIGFCGKEGQSVPVGDGGAHVRTKAAVGGAG